MGKKKLEEIRSRTPQEIKDRVDRTVRERDAMCSLLEAFAKFLEEEGYTEGVSNTQRYKMLGNGWTVDVIAHILCAIKRN